MAKMPDIQIGFKIRPCLVLTRGETVKAFFHAWTARQCLTTVETYALVEYKTGCMEAVRPEQVYFLDSTAQFNGYAWPDISCNHKEEEE